MGAVILGLVAGAVVGVLTGLLANQIRVAKTGRNALMIACGIVAAIAVGAYATAKTTGPGNTPNHQPSATSSSGSASPMSSAQTSGNSGAAGEDAPGCYAPDQSPVACVVEHDSEVFQATTCDAAELITYMGGDPGIEVLAPLPTLTQAEPGSCRASDLSESQRTTSLARFLDTSRGSTIRVCRNSQPRDSFGCDRPHEAELIYSQADDVDCAAAFQEYALTPFARFDRELKLTKETQEARVQCWVGVRGTNLLSTSLRKLRDQSLPLAD
ncbi:MAG: hypothetical protein V9G19_04630 [Tetrasphaera sp.]